MKIAITCSICVAPMKRQLLFLILCGRKNIFCPRATTRWPTRTTNATYKICSMVWGEGPSSRDVKELTDHEIANLPVQEVNKLLRTIPWEEARRLRKRRRTLKNRGYSLSCRLRKQREHNDVINENISFKNLHRELIELAKNYSNLLNPTNDLVTQTFTLEIVSF